MRLKTLEQVLAENKKAMRESNKRHQEFMKKVIKDREKEQSLQRGLVIVVIVLSSLLVYFLLEAVTTKEIRQCITAKGENYCVSKLG